MDITVTASQLKALRRLDANLTAQQVVQTHVDTWLAPIVQELADTDRKDVIAAYLNATPATRTAVKDLLGLG